jgi:prepilin-type N-terminal cleavage/methylation domain-containing protein
MKNSYANTPAFTIVELLIVIVVIGILAIMSLVAYNGITNSAYDAAIKSDFTNFIKKYETIRVLDESNQYPTPTAAMGFSFSKSAYMTGRNNMYLCINSDRSQYAISAQSRSGKNFRYSTLTGTIETPNDVGYDLTCIAAGTTSSAASFSASAYYTTTGWASWAH